MSSEFIMSNITIWRQKCRDGTITTEEMKQAIEAIRKERVQASVKNTATRAKKADAKAGIDSDAMLGELGLDL